MSRSTLDVDLRTRLHSDGEIVHALDGSTFSVENPVQAAPLADVAETKAADIDCAV